MSNTKPILVPFEGAFSTRGIELQSPFIEKYAGPAYHAGHPAVSKVWSFFDQELFWIYAELRLNIYDPCKLKISALSLM